MSPQIDTSAGTLEEQLREGFLAGLSFDPKTPDRVKIFTQPREDAEWEIYTQSDTLDQSFTPQRALPILVALWERGFGLKVEATQHLTEDWDED